MKPMTSTAQRCHIRWMIQRDLPEICSIELRTAGPAERDSGRPWTEEGIRECLRSRNVIGMVAEGDGQIRGHMIYRLHRESIEILRLVVDPRNRQQDIGRLLLRKLVSKLSERGRTRLCAPIPDWNLDGQLFLRACGFRANKVNRRALDDGATDVYRMVYTLDSSSNRKEDE